MNKRKVIIDPLSTSSLFLELRVRDNPLSNATGFIVKNGDLSYLITNWHVLSGRSSQSNQINSPTGAVPDSVRIAHHGTMLGTWTFVDEPILNDDGHPLWVEHPRGREIDVVALPITQVPDQITLHPFDLSLSDTDMIPQVAMPVSIIGFPLGLAVAGAFPIWKTGHIASDPDIDYQGIPAFIIDATTRGGMSGSPVVLRMSGGFLTREGHMIMASGPRTRFLGVYSGRIHIDSEIGIVWRPFLIQEILGRNS